MPEQTALINVPATTASDHRRGPRDPSAPAKARRNITSVDLGEHGHRELLEHLTRTTSLTRGEILRRALQFYATQHGVTPTSQEDFQAA